MDQNIAYKLGQQKRTTRPIDKENMYDDLDTTEGGKSGKEKSKATLLLGRCLVGIVAIAAVLALALAVGAIINPRRACAKRVTVLACCVCVLVC